MKKMRGPHRRIHVLRLLGWNVLLLTTGLALIAATGEAWLRLTKQPFMHPSHSQSFVPGVGMPYEPGSEMRSTNQSDFWRLQERFGLLAYRSDALGQPGVAEGESLIPNLRLPRLVHTTLGSQA